MKLEEKLSQTGFSLFRDYDLCREQVSNEKIKAPVDFVIKTEAKQFLIEIEMHRADPSNNIAKIAYCLEHLKKDAIVIQWFSSNYKGRANSHKAKRVLAEYLGRQLLGESYHSIECKMDKLSFEELYSRFEKGKNPDTKALERIAEETYIQIRDVIIIH